MLPWSRVLFILCNCEYLLSVLGKYVWDLVVLFFGPLPICVDISRALVCVCKLDWDEWVVRYGEDGCGDGDRFGYGDGFGDGSGFSEGDAYGYSLGSGDDDGFVFDDGDV